MEKENNKNINKMSINDRSVVYNCWQYFWDDVCEAKLDKNIPVRFFWSGDDDLNIRMMSVHVCQIESRSLIECIINDVSRDEFNKHIQNYKSLILNSFEEHFVKTIEDY